MFEYQTSNSKILHSPNSVFAMCRQRGKNIILFQIPVTWKRIIRD
jgi:hypothetical protein